MPLHAALDAWLARFTDRRIRMRDLMRPGADDAALAALEAATGLRLPEEMRELYRRVDGQISPYKVTYRAPLPNIIELPIPLAADEYVGNLFGTYEFLPLEGVLREWQSWAAVRDASTPEQLASDFDGAITVRAGDGVRPHYTHLAWLPIAADGGGNAYAVDLDPAPGGTVGQIIVIGPDEDLRRVLAPDLATLFARAAAGGIGPDHGRQQRYAFDLEASIGDRN